jgi:hypothetical protein
MVAGSEQGLEARHRVAPAVPAKDELVEVDRELVGPGAAVPVRDHRRSLLDVGDGEAQ